MNDAETLLIKQKDWKDLDEPRRSQALQILLPFTFRIMQERWPQDWQNRSDRETRKKVVERLTKMKAMMSEFNLLIDEAFARFKQKHLSELN